MTMNLLQDFPLVKLQGKANEFRHSDYEDRIQILSRLKSLLVENQDSLCKALKQDLGKHDVEGILTEISPCTQEINYFKKHLRSLMKQKSVSSSLAIKGSSNWILPEAKGLVLILSPWNYPLNLAIMPTIAALAAGNVVCLKASEFTKATTKLLYDLIQQYQLHDYIHCIEGDHQVAANLCHLPFDHIFFTGSTKVGSLVMQAAAKNLCPVTLELGGKSPCIIDSTANIKTAAERIMWGKYTNAGQTCVAPDYLLVHSSIKEEFIAAATQKLQDFFGSSKEETKESADYGRIITKQHLQRLQDLLNDAINNGANLICGGEVDETNRYMAPTLLEAISFDHKIMQEEIFGPLLPILTYDNLEDLKETINKHPQPLALYVFSQNKEFSDTIRENFRSGALCINTVVTHLANPHLPFGGIGTSGMGSYHGSYGFNTFSHFRSLHKLPAFSGLNLFLPPYNEKFMHYFNKARSLIMNL